jgi:hypothetical protein
MTKRTQMNKMMTTNRRKSPPPPPHLFQLTKSILTTTLILTLALATASCKEDGESTDSGSNGGSITITEQVAYIPEGITNMTETRAQTDFSFVWGRNNDEEWVIKPLSDFINAPASVKVNGGKVIINLGTPKSEYMMGWDWAIEDGITVIPSDAKYWSDNEEYDPIFYTSNSKYGLSCINGDIANYELLACARLIYVDKDVTVKGTYWNASIKKGWDYLILPFPGAANNIATASTTLPSGFKWYVVED